jgi:hypothetical protein
MVIKKTRTLALASLPVTMFVLFFSNGKSEGYFVPEILLLTFSIGLVKILIAKTAGSLFSRNFYIFLKIALVYIFCLRLYNKSEYLVDVVKTRYPDILNAILRENEMLTMRASSQYLLGTQAKVGSRMDLWYVSGAKDWFSILPDVYWGDKYPVDSLKTYFSAFDVIVDHSHFTNNTQRKDQETISSLYLDGRLKLKNFYITNNFDSEPFYTNVLPMLFYSVRDTGIIRGISCWNNQRLKYYEEDSVDFDCILVLGVVSNDLKHSLPFHSFSFCNLMALPDKEGNQYQFEKDAQDYLIWGILPGENIKETLSLLTEYIRVKEIVTMRSAELNINSLLKRNETRVNFYKSYNDFLRMKAYY